jgi:hypothetical protein
MSCTTLRAGSFSQVSVGERVNLKSCGDNADPLNILVALSNLGIEFHNILGVEFEPYWWNRGAV